jgi:hypothetical protein
MSAPPLLWGVRAVSPVAPTCAVVIPGRARCENQLYPASAALLESRSSARFAQTGTLPLSHRGSGWAALALSRRLALGATTSSLSNEQAHEPRFVGLLFFVNPVSRTFFAESGSVRRASPTV